MKSNDVNHTLRRFVSFFQKLAIYYFLRVMILRGELMMFTIYDNDNDNDNKNSLFRHKIRVNNRYINNKGHNNNVQQCMRALHPKFVKLHNLYILENILAKLMVWYGMVIVYLAKSKER